MLFFYFLKLTPGNYLGSILSVQWLALTFQQQAHDDCFMIRKFMSSTTFLEFQTGLFMNNYLPITISQKYLQYFAKLHIMSQREHRNVPSVKKVLACTFILFCWHFAQQSLKGIFYIAFMLLKSTRHLQSAQGLWASNTNYYHLESVLQM